MVDCLYDARFVEPFLSSIYKLVNETGTVLIAYDRHDLEAIEEFWDQVQDYFQTESIPFSELDHQYQDQHIQVFKMKKRAK